MVRVCMFAFFSRLGVLFPVLSEMIRHLNDPEHPLTLEQLNVLTVSV